MSEIDDYLGALDAPQRDELERIRLRVRLLVPQATEVMSYGMPGFRYRKKYLIHYAAFKNHLSLFPGAGPIAALADELAGFKLAKGTIQFTVDQPVPDHLLELIVRHRVASIDAAKPRTRR